jgi:hypothetical protein
MRLPLLAALALGGACSLVLSLLGSCNGTAVMGGSGGAQTTVAGNGGGGSAGVGLFDAGGTAFMLPDGCAGPPAGDAAYDGPTGCEGIEAGVTYQDVGSILAGCTGESCHGSPTHDELVGIVATECCDGRLLVDPGNAALSYLMDKVTGQNLCYATRMPLDQPPLSDADLLTLRRWICEGAPGN